MSTAIKTNEEIIGRVASDLWTGGDVAAVDELYAEDCIVHEPQRGTIHGHESVESWVSEVHEAFPDLEIAIDEVLTCEGHACGTWSMTGTHTGELKPMGIPATGKSVEVDGLFIARIEDGKIIEEWNMSDAVSMLEQIGLFEQ